MARPSLALVGIGKIAVDQHIPSIAETGTFNLVAVVSRGGAAVPGARTFRSQAELFAAMPDLDAIANCTPPHIRHAATIVAACRIWGGDDRGAGGGQACPDREAAHRERR
jgi:D-galactose 1-dehydrogenase